MDSFWNDWDLMDRGFTPYWRHNMALDIGNEFNEVIDNDEKFVVSIDVSHFKPEELKEKTDGSNSLCRSFVRKWTLPADVEVTSIQSSITSDGKLAIEAPKIGRATIRSIPIVPAISGNASR
ncbi:unnamed protein product [Auanema sp. JU1783]|nr:unnamed protein product [Auanema sp. JU1783]